MRNGSSGHSAVTATSVKVNEVPGVAAVVLPPFFREPAGKWVMVKSTPRADSPTRTAEYPFALEGESFIPAALPTLDSSSTADVVVATYNFAGKDKLEPLQVSSEITGPDGKTRPIEVQVVKRSDKERSGGRALLLSLQTRRPPRRTLRPQSPRLRPRLPKILRSRHRFRSARGEELTARRKRGQATTVPRGP